MFGRLHILHHTQIYPEKSGGCIRTFNIAKLASEKFDKTYIFAVDENITRDYVVDGIYIIQEKKYLSTKQKYDWNIYRKTLQDVYDAIG